MTDQEDDHIVFRYATALDEHGVIDGRDLAAKLIEDAFSLLVPYTKGCSDCAVSLFTGAANKVIHRQMGQKVLEGRICSYKGQSDDENVAFFAAHRDQTQSVTDALRDAGAGARDADIRHRH